MYKLSAIEKLEKSLADNKFSEKDLNILKEINESDLLSLINMKNTANRDYLIKAYFTTYNDEVVSSVEKNTNSNIYKIFSNVWVSEAINNSPSEILLSYLGVTLLETNFISKIRENIDNKKDLDLFERQVYDVIDFLNKRLVDNELLSVIFSTKDSISDKDLLSKMSDTDRALGERLIRKVLFIGQTWEYFLLKANGDDDNELKSSLSSSNYALFAEHMLPSMVYSKISHLFSSDNLNIAEIISSEISSDIIVEDLNESIVCKSDMKGESFYDSFKSVKSKIKDNVSGKNKSKKSKKVSFKKIPEKSGHGKLIVFGVLILITISVSFAYVMNKVNDKSIGTSVEKIILNDNVEAKVEFKKKINMKELNSDKKEVKNG
jgi:hypothetical protein